MYIYSFYNYSLQHYVYNAKKSDTIKRAKAVAEMELNKRPEQADFQVFIYTHIVDTKKKQKDLIVACLNDRGWSVNERETPKISVKAYRWAGKIVSKEVPVDA